MTSNPLVRRTLATLRSAEFGFLGVVVYTLVQTPRFWGLRLSAGLLLLVTSLTRDLRTSWLTVGIVARGGLERPRQRQITRSCTQRLDLPDQFSGNAHLVALRRTLQAPKIRALKRSLRQPASAVHICNS